MNITPFDPASLTMSSREIAELVGSRHDNVRVTIERLAERGVIALPATQEKPTGGRPSVEYLFSGTKGKRDSLIVVAQLCPEFTARIVDRWQELEEQAAQSQFNLPKDFPEALRLAAKLAEENAALEHKVAEQGALVAEQAPKVEAHDRITHSDGRLNLTNTAKNLDVPPRKLTDWMHENNWIYRRVGGTGWVAYQAMIKAGYLTHKVYIATRDDGSEKTCEQVMVTPKGLAKLSAVVPRVSPQLALAQ